MCLYRVQVGGRGKGNRVTVDKGKRQAATGRGGRKAPQKQRTCEDCEENVATHFCADCQPPLVLCDDCAAVLHRGARRRNHQLKGVRAGHMIEGRSTKGLGVGY